MSGIVPRNDALAEIEQRLSQIHNEQAFTRDERAIHVQAIRRCDKKLADLDRIETDYVALLVPKQEGIPA